MHIGVANDPTRPLIDEIRWIAANGFGFVDLHIAPPNAALESTSWKDVRAQLEGAGIAAICRARPTCPSTIPPRSSARPCSTSFAAVSMQQASWARRCSPPSSADDRLIYRKRAAMTTFASISASSLNMANPKALPWRWKTLRTIAAN